MFRLMSFSMLTLVQMLIPLFRVSPQEKIPRRRPASDQKRAPTPENPRHRLGRPILPASGVWLLPTLFDNDSMY